MRLIDLTPPPAGAPLDRTSDDHDATPLDPYVGPARVIECAGIEEIGAAEALWAAGAERALYRVLADGGLGPRAAARLTIDGARTLVRLGVRVFGTDAPPDEAQDGEHLEARRILDAAGVATLEHLSLAGVAPGEYDLIVLPLARRGDETLALRAMLRVRD